MKNRGCGSEVRLSGRWGAERSPHSPLLRGRPGTTPPAAVHPTGPPAPLPSAGGNGAPRKRPEKTATNESTVWSRHRASWTSGAAAPSRLCLVGRGQRSARRQTGDRGPLPASRAGRSGGDRPGGRGRPTRSRSGSKAPPPPPTEARCLPVSYPPPPTRPEAQGLGQGRGWARQPNVPGGGGVRARGVPTRIRPGRAAVRPARPLKPLRWGLRASGPWLAGPHRAGGGLAAPQTAGLGGPGEVTLAAPRGRHRRPAPCGQPRPTAGHCEARSGTLGGLGFAHQRGPWGRGQAVGEGKAAAILSWPHFRLLFRRLRVPRSSRGRSRARPARPPLVGPRCARPPTRPRSGAHAQKRTPFPGDAGLPRAGFGPLPVSPALSPGPFGARGRE